MFNDEDTEFDINKLTNLDSITIIRNPGADNEVSNKKYVDDSIGEVTIVKFNQTLGKRLELSVGNDIYNLTKVDKIQLVDTTRIKQGKKVYLLPRWNVICNDKNNIGVTTIFISATKTHTPTNHSIATSLSPIGISFMFIETSSNFHGNIIFVDWERTDIIQIIKITI